MFCAFCGKQIPDTAKFCPACGRSATEVVKVASTPKKKSWIKWAGIAVGACASVALIAGAIVSFVGGSSHQSGGGHSAVSSRRTDTYEISGLEFEVPSELEWDDIYEHYDWIGLNGDEISVDAELYEEEDLYNCDITDIESFITFADWAYSQNRGYHYSSDIQKFKNGYYSIIEAEDSSCIVSVYLDGDVGWLLCFTVYDSDDFDEYLSMGIDIVTSGHIR
ncbi:MAG: zinc-ribbon domain-containing protein [Oscillospiraceae bacterium]|nr:zinc-ribbon domain-containing protein [Oscillospiraceae bacterium]